MLASLASRTGYDDLAPGMTFLDIADGGRDATERVPRSMAGATFPVSRSTRRTIRSLEFSDVVRVVSFWLAKAERAGLAEGGRPLRTIARRSRLRRSRASRAE